MSNATPAPKLLFLGLYTGCNVCSGDCECGVSHGCLECGDALPDGADRFVVRYAGSRDTAHVCNDACVERVLGWPVFGDGRKRERYAHLLVQLRLCRNARKSDGLAPMYRARARQVIAELRSMRIEASERVATVARAIDGSFASFALAQAGA